MLSRIFSLILCFFLGTQLFSQTLGGSATYNFLKLQQVPEVAALGGRNVSAYNGGIGMINENPALLSSYHHLQTAVHFNFLAPGITSLLGITGFHEKATNTVLAMVISHIMYGNEEQTDAGGNTIGSFRAYDQMLSISASRSYGEKWRYGLTLKGIHSRYGTFVSTGLAADAGITYRDSARKMQIGFSVKNMGSQLRTYNGRGEDLPFDMLMGITKQLEKAPFRFSMTAQRLNRFDILYNDTSFNVENTGRNGLAGWGDKLISHLILGGDILLGEKVVISGGYDFLRRKELSFSNISSGLTGFSYGMRLKLSSFSFQYARSHFQSGLSHHLVSLNLQLGRYSSD